MIIHINKNKSVSQYSLACRTIPCKNDYECQRLNLLCDIAYRNHIPLHEIFVNYKIDDQIVADYAFPAYNIALMVYAMEISVLTEKYLNWNVLNFHEADIKDYSYFMRNQIEYFLNRNNFFA